jgi:hypothetical protein
MSTDSMIDPTSEQLSEPLLLLTREERGSDMYFHLLVLDQQGNFANARA